MDAYLTNISSQTEPPQERCDQSLCETCRHCVIVTDRAKSGQGRLRVLEVCVAEHDETGEDWGDIITEPVHECQKHKSVEEDG